MKTGASNEAEFFAVATEEFPVRFSSTPRSSTTSLAAIIVRIRQGG